MKLPLADEAELRARIDLIFLLRENGQDATAESIAYSHWLIGRIASHLAGVELADATIASALCERVLREEALRGSKLDAFKARHV